MKYFLLSILETREALDKINISYLMNREGELYYEV